MMNSKVCFGIFFLISVSILEGSAQQQSAITTVILIRHAEKGDDGTKDPDLSADGQARAKRLAVILKDTKIEAIYSTNYKRTKNTVLPLSADKGIDIQLYDPMKTQAIDEIMNKYKGKTIVITGHSNTTPWTANYLLGNGDIKDFADDDFDNILIVSSEAPKRGTLTWISY
jgi:2,3-bisphosphoglycerate-dependent phosphoglycerate mutase